MELPAKGRAVVERCYVNRELFSVFGVSDYESLLVKLAEIGVRPHRDDLNKRACVVWHRLPNELVVPRSRSIATIGDLRVTKQMYRGAG